MPIVIGIAPNNNCLPTSPLVNFARLSFGLFKPKDPVLGADFAGIIEEIGEGVAVRDPSEVVTFRASQSELSAFDAEWQARGFANRSQALKAVVRARCGFMDVTANRLDGFVETWHQSRDLTDAGMALAKAVRRGRMVLTEEDRALVSELVELAQKMTRELGSMKDLALVQRGVGLPDLVEANEDESVAEVAANG